MVWAFITRVPDILQAIGLATVLAGAVYVTIKVVRRFG